MTVDCSGFRPWIVVDYLIFKNSDYKRITMAKIVNVNLLPW
jgi:hypothetical protein